MKLTFFEGEAPNFGDEINRTMWNHLLPRGFLDEDDSDLFLGAGSILWHYLPKRARKFVMGSGFGGYSTPPDMRDGSWHVSWVRGPITAERLNLDPRMSICDAAILLRETPLPAPSPKVRSAFMPHFESVMRGDWEKACALADITYLDPRADTDTLLAKIRGADLVVAEAMHGAIVADALRTPWIGIQPFHKSHRPKWDDWAQSLDIALRPIKLPPSNLLESYTLLTGLDGKGARSARIFRSAPTDPANTLLVKYAARRLRRIAETVEPQLSSDSAIERATERSMTALHSFVSRRLAA